MTPVFLTPLIFRAQCSVVAKAKLRSQTIWVCIHHLLAMTLGKLFNRSKPQFPYYKYIDNSRSYLTGLFGGSNEFKFLQQCLAQGRHSVCGSDCCNYYSYHQPQRRAQGQVNSMLSIHSCGVELNKCEGVCFGLPPASLACFMVPWQCPGR